jgi:hypothetical protein
VVDALNELSGHVVPDQALDAFSASYLDSNSTAKESSWTKMSGEVCSVQSSYIGAERKPS